LAVIVPRYRVARDLTIGQLQIIKPTTATGRLKPA
jgi:hypothetical protein